MLQFNPTARAEVQDAVRLPYFEKTFSEADIVNDMRLGKVDWSFDDFQPTRALLQKYIYSECARFHPELLESDDDIPVDSHPTPSPVAGTSAAATAPAAH